MPVLYVLYAIDNVAEDPEERNELSQSHPQQLRALLQRYAALRPGIFAPDRGTKDPRACEVAVGLYGVPGQGGFWGPFAFLNESSSSSHPSPATAGAATGAATGGAATGSATGGAAG